MRAMWWILPETATMSAPLSVQAAAAAPTATISAAPEPTGNVLPLTRFPPHSWEAFTDGDGIPALCTESSVCGDEPVRPPYTEKTELSAQIAAYIRRRSPVPGSRAALRAVCSATRSTFPASARPRPTGWRLPWGASGIGATARIPT